MFGMGKITWTHKLLYSSGSLAANILFATMNMWLMYRYVPPKGRLLVPLLVFSFIMGAGRLIDGVIDPLVGYWSDSIRTRWGRRRPFIAVGTPALIIVFFFLWLPPDPHVSRVNIIYFIILVNAFFLLYTLVMIPMMAVLPEMATGDRDRVAVSGAQMAFGLLGTIAASMGVGVLIARLGYHGMALALGALTFIFFMTALAGIREPEQPAGGAHVPLAGAFAATFTNKDFLAFAVSVVFFWMGFNMLLQITPYFLTQVMLMKEAEMWKLMAPLMCALLLVLPPVIYISGRVSKKTIYSVCMAALGVIFPLLMCVGRVRGMPLALQGMIFMAAVGVTAAPVFILPNAIIGDIADNDELRTGMRREAMYFGVYCFLQKLAMAVSAVMLGFLYYRFGYVAPHVLGIRLAGPVTGVCIFLGLAVFHFGYHCKPIVKDAE
jgi:GPH family glycoside/pentoside/hexuronide:cation symporter